MFEGDRYYFDRNGRYRGKSSEFGAISHAFWPCLVLGFLAYWTWEAVAPHWKLISFAMGLVGVPVFLMGLFISCDRPRHFLWVIPTGVFSAAALLAPLIARLQ